jgi:hypothetical protein
VINLADERNVREEHDGANEMQRFGHVRMPAVAPDKPPAGVRSAEQRQSTGELDEARDGVPVRRDEQDDAGADQDGADDRQDGEKPVAFAVQLEVRDDGLALVFGDETGFVDIVDVGKLHVMHVDDGLRQA